MHKPKLIIFDMDGLMIDSESLAIAGWKSVAAQLSIDIPEELYLSLIGLSNALSKVRMGEHYGPDFDFDTVNNLLHKYLDDHYEEHGVPLKPGILHILDKLDEMGIKKCVATSTFYDRALYKLTKVGIAHRFNAIIGGDHVRRSKPAPDIFLKAAEVCNTQPMHCIVLEDSNPGAEAAYRAGMPVIVIPDMVTPTDITRERAYAVCESLYKACEIIEELHDSNKNHL